MPSVCAIIVSYHTGNRILANLSILVPQVTHIVVVDNGSDLDTLTCLEQAQTQFRGSLKVILNGQNLGLSKAQNIGIRAAVELGCEWMLLLDDDSTPAEDMVVRMHEHFLSLSEQDRQQVGILYPNIVDKQTSRKSVFLVQDHQRIQLVICPDDGILHPLIAMASGSLIKTDTIRRIGLMDERFFIDQIDVDFSIRVINNGLSILVVGNAYLFHSLGVRREFKILGYTITPTNHSAFRCYHIFRNRVIVWGRYIKTNSTFVFFDAFIALYHLFKIIIFEDQKLYKLGNIIAGIFDGLLFGLRDRENEVEMPNLDVLEM